MAAACHGAPAIRGATHRRAVSAGPAPIDPRNPRTGSFGQVTTLPEADLGHLYRDTRERLSGLVLGLEGSELAASVPACPGWSVSDVMCHLVAVVEDVMAGRLTRPPTEQETAAQVARHQGTSMADLVQTWAELAPPFEALVAGAVVWPAVLDLATHEQDIRGALGRAGARDTEVVRLGAERLLALMKTSLPVRVICEDFETRVGPEDEGHPELVLRTTRFETLRWRMGRRSHSQLRALDWSADPACVIDQLFIFGPSRSDIVE